MTVRDIYLLTNDTEPVQILRGCTTLYVGCSIYIPSCMFDRNVLKISQSMYAIVLNVD